MVRHRLTGSIQEIGFGCAPVPAGAAQVGAPQNSATQSAGYKRAGSAGDSIAFTLATTGDTMRKHNQPIETRLPPDGEPEVAKILLDILRAALAVVPHGTLGAGILFANYADREFFFAALNDWMPVLP